MAQATQTYAESRNAKFDSSESHFINVVERFEATYNSLPKRGKANFDAKLKEAIRAFKKSYPKVKSLNERTHFPLVKATEVPMLSIMIDTTMQREPDLQWILKIITNFRAYQAQPIQVFGVGGEVDSGWGAWDSQHTAIALYLIAKYALNLDLTTVTVPANIYEISSRADIRNLFINMNSTTGKNAGKKPLDIIDIFEQKIFGVEKDGVTDPDWVAAHTKWKHIANAGMFITADKFNNTEEIGAISRLNEIDEFSAEVVRQFSVYGKYIVEEQQRAINSKEIPIIISFMALCEQNDITLTDAQIEDIAQHCIDLFDANFDSKGVFWEKCHQATVNAWERINKANNLPKTAWGPAPKNNKNTPTGLSFFWHQLKNTWAPKQGKGFKFPKQPMNIYVPSTTDLF